MIARVRLQATAPAATRSCAPASYPASVFKPCKKQGYAKFHQTGEIPDEFSGVRIWVALAMVKCQARRQLLLKKRARWPGKSRISGLSSPSMCLRLKDDIQGRGRHVAQRQQERQRILHVKDWEAQASRLPEHQVSGALRVDIYGEKKESDSMAEEPVEEKRKS